MLTLAAWLAEYLLETLGMYLAFRSRLRPLGFYLAFRASSDLILFAIMYENHGGDFYAWSYWGQQAGAALLLCWLSVSICSRMVGEGPRRAHMAIVVALLVSGAVLGGFQGQSIGYKLLKASVNVDVLLGIAILAGLVSQKIQLARQWTLIAWAVAIHLGSRGIVQGASHIDERALRFLPVGELLALGVWIVAGWKKPEDSLEVLRAGLGHQIETSPSPLIQDDRVEMWN